MAPWLLLVHNLPPTPPYLRAKVMRRLTKLGALALKRSAYLLPSLEGTLEDLQWLRQEIEDEGGDAWVVEARFVAGLRDEEVRENFRRIREPEYAALISDARGLLERFRTSTETIDLLHADRRRLLRRAEAARRVDFFHANGREELEALMAAIERTGESPAGGPAVLGDLHGRTWMTRAGVKVDRMASAWLIRRFIDPAASFVFGAGGDAAAAANALRFDMFEGEFTHDGNRCTFEVLLDASGRAGDPALVAIAQIVHDLDLHDDRFQRPEAPGVSAFIAGIVARFDDDHRRLAESGPLFDALYASLGGRAAV